MIDEEIEDWMALWLHLMDSDERTVTLFEYCFLMEGKTLCLNCGYTREGTWGGYSCPKCNSLFVIKASG